MRKELVVIAIVAMLIVFPTMGTARRPTPTPTPTPTPLVIVNSQYTGCLDKDGDIGGIKIGILPLFKCGRKESTITWNNATGQGANGKDGKDGVNLTMLSIDNNGDGTYTWHFSDLFNFTTGNLKGEKGEKGEKGDTGGGDTFRYNWRYFNESSPFNSDDVKSVTAQCHGGRVVGGGFRITPNANLTVYESYPSSEVTWTVSGMEINPTDDDWSVTAYAICDGTECYDPAAC